MSLNIQLADGTLKEINEVTKEKIITALDYTPANEEDLPNITEDNSGELTIADESGNIIARIDADGVHSTEVEAKGIFLGETVLEHTNNSSIHVTSSEKSVWNNKSDFSGFYQDLIDKPNIIPEDNDKSLTVIDGNGNAIMRVDEEGIHSTEVELGDIRVRETLINHTSDTNIHITSSERNKWNNKSDFSGNYTDLQDAPNITPEDDDKSLSITDEAGNAIAKFDSNGLETTQVTAKSMFVNGVSVESKLDEHTTDIGELQTRLNALADSDDITLDQLSEIVAYIKSNKSLIDSITTNKVSVSDIIDNLTTAVVNKPLSANQGVVIKSLIDGLRSDLNAHINNTTSHITSDERTKWNNKSDFSGNYVDLVDAPNITPESEDKSLTIIDESGNKIVVVDENGLETTTITAKSVVINGVDVISKLDEHTDNIALKVNTSDIVDNLTTSNTKKLLSANQGVKIKQSLDALQNDLGTQISDVNDALTNHKNDKVSHITSEERTSWNNKSEFSGSYNDLTNVPTDLATESFVNEKIDGVVDSAPTTLNTLNKLSKALGNDKDFATNVTKSIAEKAKQSDLDEHTDDTTVHITSAERTAWNNKANQSALDEHNNNTVKHITSSERTKWNNKSDFSGSYNDLTDAPNITENGTGDLIICDNNGNIIFRSNSDGFETTKLTVNTIVLKGTDVESKLNELSDKVGDGFVAVTKAQIDSLFA